MQELQEELTGIIDRFLFQNTDNGYAVFYLLVPRHNAVTVTGYFPHLQVGEQVTLKGSWIFHLKFGKQFEAHQCTASLPTSVVGLKKYLGSGLIKGIGKVYAEKMVDYFGATILEVIDQQPHRLEEISGIGPGRVACIAQAWQHQKEIAGIMVFLQDKGISPAYATKIFKQYGQEARVVIQENPYRLADEVWGIGFKTADRLAQQLGFEQQSLKRIKAGIIFSITQAVSNGHLYVVLADLKKQCCELLELDQASTEPLLKQAFNQLYDEQKIKLISIDTTHFITLPSYYFSEKGVAARIRTLLKASSQHTFDLNALYQQLRAPTAHEIALNEDQQRGIIACLQNKVTIISGGPGTGKTTLIKKLLDILDTQRMRTMLAAPTGRAAKRMMEGTGRYALTLHRLLEFDFKIMGFAHNEQNALKVDFLIVDESSMLDIFLAHALLKALPNTAHVIFIGDIDQLPAVGAGNFLHDLIASDLVATVRLTQIFRQAQDSLIVVNAHRVNKGEFPVSHLPNARRDFVFIKEDKPENLIEHLTHIFKKVLPACSLIPEQATILAPMHRGVAGTQQLNYLLQQLLNPHATDIKVTHTGTTFKSGDKVMQIKNNYDKAVFNGDVGFIHTINLDDQQLVVNYDDRLVTYDFDELNEIVLAYALSIHKSQGSEYPAVIIPLFMQHFTLLQRNLVYTAITRAKKLCILIGQTKAIAMAIKNNKSMVRITFLKEFLTTDLQCR
jgi:exodeoxyribonuclease V alpha subunit